ncbi:MAG TPA: HPr(Ser) kinase/phosphatase [Gemmatimonadota bacterium]|nr:HPr(Ser) kinase/phosphatase [Gemmatimonadota bacterium]
MASLTVAELLSRKAQPLGLTLLTEEGTAGREIPSSEAASPGLVLAGYTDRFVHSRVQVLGETEITYLETLSESERASAIQRFLDFDLPVVFITKGLEPPAGLLERANARGIPVVSTRLKTGAFYSAIKAFLETFFAPSTYIHGSLADVYGVGLLFVGRSGIGKSECVLDLVERGHRLVADDQVYVMRRAAGLLLGRGSDVLGFHMEIRGVGIIDIQSFFGIRAVRLQKRIEVVVRLEEWDETTHVERVGLEEEKTEILEVELPLVRVPLNPGKNITVIAEVVAMNHLLRFAGRHGAERFNQRLIDRMRTQAETDTYLEEDYE